MKIIPTILIALFISVSYSQQNMDTIYGNPKYVREKVEFLNEKKQNYKFLDIDGDYGHATIFTPKNIKSIFNRFWFHNYGCFYVNYEKEFLKTGLAKSETWYNRDGSIEEKYNYKYDIKNNLIEKKDFYYDGEYRLMKYHYDKNDSIISIGLYYSDKPNEFMHTYYVRDINNNLIERKKYTDNGRQNSFIYEIDSVNRRQKEFRKEIFYRKNFQNKKLAYRDSFGLKKPLKEYEYDLFGNKIKEIRYNEDSKKVSSKTVFKYDYNNKLIYKGLIRDSLLAYNNYFYNNKKLLIKSEYINIKSPQYNKIHTYGYNEAGYINKVFYTKFDSYPLKEIKYKIIYNYKFDKKGNWIKITKIVNGEPLYVWTRKIKYY